jgi:hypothetical protein
MMLGDLDLIHMARNERASLDLRNERASMESASFSGSERPSLDMGSLRRNSTDSIDFTSTLRRASTGSASSWAFLSTSPTMVAGSAPTAAGAYFPAALLARQHSLQAEQKQGEKLDKIPRLIRTLSKGLDPFR